MTKIQPPEMFVKINPMNNITIYVHTLQIATNLSEPFEFQIRECGSVLSTTQTCAHINPCASITEGLFEKVLEDS